MADAVSDMYPTTAGTFRVLTGRDPSEWLLLEVERADPTYIPSRAVPDVRAGNRIDATLRWIDDTPDVEEYTVVEPTRLRFRRTEEPIFQAAQECFEAARSDGAALNSRVTFDTDRDPNGVVYTFAEQPGRRDIYEEFQDGTTPLEPLLERAARSNTAEPPFSVWVLDPIEPFVVVYVVLDPDGLLDETMGDTYGGD